MTSTMLAATAREGTILQCSTRVLQIFVLTPNAYTCYRLDIKIGHCNWDHLFWLKSGGVPFHDRTAVPDHHRTFACAATGCLQLI